MSEGDEILYEAEQHALAAQVFEAAKEQALGMDYPEFLILMSDGTDLYTYANEVETSRAVLLAQAFITKAVETLFPHPLEDAE